MVPEERPCADFPTTQLMQERITIRFRPGLELRLYPNPRHSQVDSDREKHGKHMGKTWKKTHVRYILIQHHATLGPPNPVTPFFPFNQKTSSSLHLPRHPRRSRRGCTVGSGAFWTSADPCARRGQITLRCFMERVWKILKWKCTAGKTIEQNTGLLLCLTTGGYQ